MPNILSVGRLLGGSILGGFSPRSLFASNEVGGWYDPSDLTTMFQDAAGTTAAALESPVGLVLDKSKGLTTSAELLTNPGPFSATTGWTGNAVTVLSTASSRLVATYSSTDTFYQAITVEAGKWYFASATLKRDSGSGTAYMNFRDGTTLASSIVGNWNSTGTTSSSDVVLKATYYASANGTVYLHFPCSTASSTVVSFSAISTKTIAGNHLSQSTSTARPVLSARVNLLTRTEEFDNAAWSLVGIKAFGAGSIANDTLAPNGTSTADYIQEDTSNGQHIVYSQNFSRVGPSFTASICAKAKERSVLLFTLQDAAFGSPPYAIFDLSNGSYTVNSGAYPSNSGATASIVSLGNGWYRCTLSATNYSQANININICISDSTSPTLTSYNRPTYTGDGSSGLYIWGADLRPSNAGVGLPAYQRVTTATEYDAGDQWPRYLKFDGVDDFLRASSFALPLVQRMTMVAFSEEAPVANQGLVTVNPASGNDYDSTTGYVLCPSNRTGARLSVVGSTSTTYQVDWTTSPAALIGPTVATEDKTSGTGYFRVNGAQVGSDTSFTEFSATSDGGLLIGARWLSGAVSSSLEFNGRVYGVIILGRRATASEIASAEAWMNGKVKAYA